MTDNGTYTVEASNVYGSVNTTTVVTVTRKYPSKGSMICVESEKTASLRMNMFHFK